MSEYSLNRCQGKDSDQIEKITYCMYYVHAFQDLSKYDMFIVQPAGFYRAYEL
jgi:hypothetical protein